MGVRDQMLMLRLCWLALASSWWSSGSLLSGPGVEKADVADAVQAVLQRGKCGTLGKKHEDAVKAFVKVGVSFGFEKLKAKI